MSPGRLRNSVQKKIILAHVEMLSCTFKTFVAGFLSREERLGSTPETKESGNSQPESPMSGS